jgi:hypothetical protein
MSTDLEQNTGLPRLVHYYLHEGEELDAMFELAADRMVAVTAERIMILTDNGSKGWSLTSIPWRVVTGVAIAPEDPENPDLGPIVRVSYLAQIGWTSKRGTVTETEGAADLPVPTIEVGEQVIEAMNRRRPTTT